MNFDWYKGNLEWLSHRTIFLTKHGSQAYGTSRPDSDLDLKGVAIPPKQYFLGWLHRFEQAESKGDPDVVVYDIRKFFGLAVDCNPNIIEVLHTSPSDHLHVSKQGEVLLAHKDLFLSQKAKHTFSGYAVAQLKRIKTHRKWLLNPPTKKPERTDFGLPEFDRIPREQLNAAESQIRKQVEHWMEDFDEVDNAARIGLINKWTAMLAEMQLHSDKVWEAAGRKLGFDENFLLYLGRERTYRGALSEWKQYNEWLVTRNEKRAELERKFGYDVKHGMHLVRLLRMCKEILSGAGVIVKRPDADELVFIRNGGWDYDRLIEYADTMEKEVEVLVKTSPLPHSPDRKKLDQLCVDLVESMS